MSIFSVIGLVLGISASNFFLVGSALSLIIWAAVSILIGLLGKTKGLSAKTASLFGICVVFAFMISGRRTSDSSNIVAFFILTLIISLIGAACASIAAVITFTLKKQLLNRKGSNASVNS